MKMIRMSAVAIGLAAVCVAGTAAQSQETQTTTKTKVEIKGGKDVTVTGCLERRPNGDYILTETRDNPSLSASRFMLVTNDDLSKHVGQRVEVKGKAVVDGDGKISVESKTKTEVDNAKDQETKTKTEATSGSLGQTFLGVSSVKTVLASCK